MRLWWICLLFALIAIESSDAQYDCQLYMGCEECLNDATCGWYNYTNSCQDILSGLPLLTDTCPPGSGDDNCGYHSSCGECARGGHCGWDSSSQICLWYKSKQGLVTNYTRCPYDPTADNCNPYNSCRTCMQFDFLCDFSYENQTCYDATWTSLPNPIKNFTQCKADEQWESDCNRVGKSQGCPRCVQEDGCGWDLQSNTCQPLYLGGSIHLSTNRSHCPYNPNFDQCTPAASCRICTIYGDGTGNQCGWSVKNRECVSMISGQKDLVTDCPYNPNYDQCTQYGIKCFSSLTTYKGICGWLPKNNTLFELDSGLDLMTDATKCPPLPNDNTCTSLTSQKVHKDQCEPCIKIKECGWSVSEKKCVGLNMVNDTYPLIKSDCPPPICSHIKTCKGCSSIPSWTCGWSFINNSCVATKNRFTVTQFPNMTWVAHEPSDPSIALNCDLDPRECSEEYMRPYLCNKTIEKYPFDIHNCYANSAVRSPACDAGFFQVNETTTDFWGKRNSSSRTVKCCPGYYCPESFICAHKCPLGSHCILSKANYTKNHSELQFGEEEGKGNKTKPIYCQPYVPTLISPQLGCGGATVDNACKEGFYCENTTSQVICPKDHFCRKASVYPSPCYGPPFFQLLKIGIDCPEGTIFPQTRMLTLLAVPILLIVVPLVYYLYTKWKAHRTLKEKLRREKRKSTEEDPLLINRRESQVYVPSIEPQVDLQVDINTLYIEKVNPIDISFSQLTVTLPDGKVILNSIDGTLFAGRLKAIMGPSGSGKTTLLSAIMGKVGGRTGQVFPKIRKCKSVLGFVPQEDVMFRELTVRENLMFSAKLRGSKTITSSQRNEIVRVVLELLGLTSVQNSAVGNENVRGISGGQRKRVNIGIELVTLPSILFLDEPTTGLDSTTSLSLCQVLKKLTEAQVNVVAVIHQPRYDIFDQFDDILLLKKGGGLVYDGPKHEIVQYFADLGYNCPVNQNPCDYLLDLISVPNDIKPKKGVVAHENKTVFQRKTTGKLAQTWWIFVRGLLQQWRDSNTLHNDLMLCIFSGVVVGMVYRNVAENLIPQAAFLLVLVSSLTSMIVSLRLFGAEKPVFWRESSSGISSISYFFGKNFSSFPSYIITGIIFLLFYYSISQPRGGYEMYFSILLVNHFCISGLAHFLSIMMHPHKAQLFGVVATMLQCTVCGFAPTLTTLKQISLILYYGAYVSFAKWMMEALFIVNVDNFSAALFGTRDNMVQVFGYDLNNLTKCFSVLIGMGIFWRVLTFLALVFANRQQRK